MERIKTHHHTRTGAYTVKLEHTSLKKMQLHAYDVNRGLSNQRQVKPNALNAEQVDIAPQSKLEPAMADSYHAELAPIIM